MSTFKQWRENGGGNTCSNDPVFFLAASEGEGRRHHHSEAAVAGAKCHVGFAGAREMVGPRRLFGQLYNGNLQVQARD